MLASAASSRAKWGFPSTHVSILSLGSHQGRVLGAYFQHSSPILVKSVISLKLQQISNRNTCINENVTKIEFSSSTLHIPKYSNIGVSLWIEPCLLIWVSEDNIHKSFSYLFQGIPTLLTAMCPNPLTSAHETKSKFLEAATLPRVPAYTLCQGINWEDKLQPLSLAGSGAHTFGMVQTLCSSFHS